MQHFPKAADGFSKLQSAEEMVPGAEIGKSVGWSDTFFFFETAFLLLENAKYSFPVKNRVEPSLSASGFFWTS